MRRIVKRRFPMAEVVGLLAFMMLGLAPYADAQTTVPNTFTTGETAVAEEVNENFQALADAINTVACPDGFTNVERAGNQLGCIQTTEADFGNTATWFAASDYCFDNYRREAAHPW